MKKDKEYYKKILRGEISYKEVDPYSVTYVFYKVAKEQILNWVEFKPLVIEALKKENHFEIDSYTIDYLLISCLYYQNSFDDRLVRAIELKKTIVNQRMLDRERNSPTRCNVERNDNPYTGLRH